MGYLALAAVGLAASLAPAASDVENALVGGGRAGKTDDGRGRQQIDPAKLPARFAFERGVAYAAQYGVDPECIGCMGGSAGAILTVLVAFTDASAGLEGEGFSAQSSRVQAAVFLSAAYDFRPESLQRLHDEQAIAAKFPGGLSLLLERDPEKRAALWQMMKSKEDDAVRATDRQAALDHPDWAAKASAVTFLMPDDPPFLAFHSKNDQLDVRFARQFAEAVKAMGRNDLVTILPGDVHGLRQPVAHAEVKKAMPVRQPLLLLGGYAFGKREFLELWRRLDADPTDMEIRRNVASRQPLLWVME